MTEQDYIEEYLRLDQERHRLINGLTVAQEELLGGYAEKFRQYPDGYVYPEFGDPSNTDPKKRGLAIRKILNCSPSFYSHGGIVISYEVIGIDGHRAEIDKDDRFAFPEKGIKYREIAFEKIYGYSFDDIRQSCSDYYGLAK